jgi:hypothetical protein
MAEPGHLRSCEQRLRVFLLEPGQQLVELRFDELQRRKLVVNAGPE